MCACGALRGQKEEQEGVRGGEKRQRKIGFISKPSLTGLVLFILPILQVRKLKLGDYLRNLGPETEAGTQWDPTSPHPLQLGVAM